MGSSTINNDTLQITKIQGFPAELDIEKHLQQPYILNDFKDKVFEFKNKAGIRNYHQPPVRNFLVENINDKWIYWGLVHILEITHDYVNKTTSGKFKIIYINSPEEMKVTFDLIDRNEQTNYFG
jgi:hypothetical protein